MTVEKINDDGLERAVVHLECEIFIHSDLESYKYNRVREICRKIARLLETAGATPDESENLMIGAAWKGSLYLMIAAPPTVFDNFMSLFAYRGDRLSLGVFEAVIIGVSPAFTVDWARLHDVVSRNRSLLPQRKLEAWPDAVTWQDSELLQLIPTSVSSFQKLVTGSMTQWEEKKGGNWVSMARILPIKEAPLHTAKLVKTLLQTEIQGQDDTDLPSVEVDTDDRMNRRENDVVRNQLLKVRVLKEETPFSRLLSQDMTSGGVAHGIRSVLWDGSDGSSLVSPLLSSLLPFMWLQSAPFFLFATGKHFLRRLGLDSFPEV